MPPGTSDASDSCVPTHEPERATAPDKPDREFATQFSSGAIGWKIFPALWNTSFKDQIPSRTLTKALESIPEAMEYREYQLTLHYSDLKEVVYTSAIETCFSFEDEFGSLELRTWAFRVSAAFRASTWHNPSPDTITLKRCPEHGTLLSEFLESVAGNLEQHLSGCQSAAHFAQWRARAMPVELLEEQQESQEHGIRIRVDASLTLSAFTPRQSSSCPLAESVGRVYNL